MYYSVEYSQSAIKALKKLDRYTKTVIKNWIDKNLVDCDNPFQYGKPLTADKKGYWRYRIGDYRIICEIKQEKVIIIVVEIGHRSEIYKKF